ncbi:MAG TPA: tyrosine-protein phosphatase [Pyrinomonadaceae bacterium]
MSSRTMGGRQGRSGVVALALLLFAATTLAQSEASYPELPNFHQVSQQLYRGAQPRDGGIRKLKELGIKTIINLRGEDEETRAEQAEAEALGLRYFSVPLPGMRRPSDEQVQRVLALINAPERQPLFVHCHHGEDRTGLIIAVYRITHDGWTSEQAKQEAKHYGMSWVQRGMKDYISDYYRDRKARQK